MTILQQHVIIPTPYLYVCFESHVVETIALFISFISPSVHIAAIHGVVLLETPFTQNDARTCNV
jgi:hypothetical protein